MPDPKKRSKKYSDFVSKDRGGRGLTGTVGFKPTQGYSAGSAPRVGGTVQSSGPVPVGGTRKQLRKSIRSVRQNAASKQAKRSAKKLY